MEDLNYYLNPQSSSSETVFETVSGGDADIFSGNGSLETSAAPESSLLPEDGVTVSGSPAPASPEPSVSVSASAAPVITAAPGMLPAPSAAPSGAVSYSDGLEIGGLEEILLENQETESLILESLQRQELQLETCISILLLIIVVGALKYLYKFFNLFFPF